jgi:hypothetical protein
MWLSKSQERELRVWEYFIPKSLKAKRTEDDVIKFFEWSERGKHKEDKSPYFYALREGKRRAGLNAGMYEDGIIDGSIPYSVVFKDKKLPREVVDYLKKEMFKGQDWAIIEEMYSKT